MSTQYSPRALAVSALQLLARLLHRKRKTAPETDIDATTIKQILWIRLDHIGDVVMSLPALHALRAGFPQARIDVLVRPGCAALFENNPDVNRVLTYDTPRFPQKKNSRGAGLFRTLNLVHQLRRQKYDCVLEMRGDDIARLLACFSTAPVRVGPDRIFYEAVGTPNFSFLMTHVVPLANEPRHAVENNLALVRVMNIELPQEEFRFVVKPQQQNKVAKELKALGARDNFVAIHACSNDAARNWKAERFAAAANYLIEEHDLDVIFTGSAIDKDYNDGVINQMNNPQHAHNAAGKFSLQELPAFYERARLMVTVDTGPMHIAAFTNTPIVALFLSHLAPRHHPYGQSDAVVPGSQDSLDDVSIEDITSAINAKLRS